MRLADLEHLDLLAQVDALLAELESWAGDAPDWPAARQCRSLVSRLAARTESLRVRVEAPLVVATLGGTGTGKSTLVNALVGEEVVQSGRQRPTTVRPTLVCRPDVTPELLGIDPTAVEVVHRDSEALRDLVLLDCPDPDTSETADDPGTNLAQLRTLLPHCDVLLVTATQQKYRSGRVLSELAAAASGARLVFVQTHATVDEDIRGDWRQTLAAEYAGGEIFFVDSLAALEQLRSGQQPGGDFARLVELLTRSLAGSAAKRIRRANFLDLIEATLQTCAERIDAALPPLESLQTAIVEQRAKLTAQLAASAREELLASRRAWEERLLAEVISSWGMSPFSLVLRGYQGLGTLVGGAALTRARTPLQVALWGAMAGTQALARNRRQRDADSSLERAVSWSWNAGELRTAAIVIDGYAGEAGFSRRLPTTHSLESEATAAGQGFIRRAGRELQDLVRRLARRHTGWFTRLRYELLLALMLGLILYRLGRNFFYDSWLAAELGFEPVAATQPVFGWDFFVHAAFWLLLWCALLIWMFTARLRRGLRGEINTLAERWQSPEHYVELFADLDARCEGIFRWRSDLEQLQAQVTLLKARLAEPEPRLGRKRSETPPVESK